MDVIILASSLKGIAAHHLNYLLKSDKINITMIIHSKGEIKKKHTHYKRKFKKMLKIGVIGALNGIRMRKWYSQDTTLYLKYNSLDKICSDNLIPYKSTPIINCKKTISFFKEANADIGLSLGNGYIGRKVFEIPKYGMINIHHEELPLYQNAQSIIWQIYNGSINTGYTIHKIDKHVDTGEILFQERVPIYFRKTLADTVAYTYSLQWEASAKGLVKVLENIDYYFNNASSQGKGKSYTTPSLFEFLRMKKQFKRLKELQSSNYV